MEPKEFQKEFPGESQLIEFKTGISRNQIQETVVAFSNAEGGVILIGVNDQGGVVGRELDSGTTDSLHQVMRDIHDPGRYSLDRLSVGGKPVVIVSVARRQEGFTQTSSGIVRVRKGTRDEPLFGSELQQFINQRAATRYELTPVVSEKEVDAALLRDLASAFGWGAENLSDRLVEHGFAAEGQLTIVGALYLMNDPAEALGKGYVEILRY